MNSGITNTLFQVPWPFVISKVSDFCVSKLLCFFSGISAHPAPVIGPLHDPVTWYKIKYTGEQVAQWDFQNKPTRTSPP